MNKKFFAALASATMAFTASGSIAVFADDFVEENTPSVEPGDLIPVSKEVVWNEDNFGALVELQGDHTVFPGLNTSVKLNKGEKVKTDDLKKVTTINLSGLKGEIKGLEYFTGLTTFTDENATLTNDALDFSANTKLDTLTVKKAADLSEIVLPEPSLNEKEEEVYSLATLDLEGTKLAALDLSAQERLVANGSVTVKGNHNLKEVTLKTVTSAKPAKLAKLDLSDNALETVDLGNYTIDTLDLSKNHIGALNLTKTTVNTTATLNEQTFYVYEKAANVNLKDAFAELDVDYVKADSKAFNSETGVLDLAKAKEYEYVTSLKGKATNKRLEVKLVAANPMNRLYNPNSGEHFYTADVKEKEALVNLGWNDEGYGWVAPTTPAKVTTTSDQPVYRLYNPNAGDHHYTMSKEERNTLVAYGWKDENVGWYSAEDASHNDETVTVWRQYNPYATRAGSHNYTTDRAENNYLVSLGWIYEGKAWKALR